MIGRLAAFFATILFIACGESENERARWREHQQSVANYDHASRSACDPASRSGAAGYTDNLRTPKAMPFSVVTPRNYAPAYSHPLLIVFAPAGMDRFEVERVTGLTQPATHAGFVVAYADHPALGPETTQDLDRIRDIVSATWCIDTSRVFYAGHSDGGTVSHALATMPQTRGHGAGIAASGAGMTDEDLASYGCPGPQAVMVMHGKRDRLFPGWGRRTAQWWAACNACDLDRATVRADGCRVYQGCNVMGPTMYCEHDATHAKWPARADAIVEFFQSVPRRANP